MGIFGENNTSPYGGTVNRLKLIGTDYMSAVRWYADALGALTRFGTEVGRRDMGKLILHSLVFPQQLEVAPLEEPSEDRPEVVARFDQSQVRDHFVLVFDRTGIQPEFGLYSLTGKTVKCEDALLALEGL